MVDYKVADYPKNGDTIVYAHAINGNWSGCRRGIVIAGTQGAEYELTVKEIRQDEKSKLWKFSGAEISAYNLSMWFVLDKVKG